MADWKRLDDRLKDLGQATTEWVSEPLPAADIRELGVRRQHRRHAAIIAVAAVLVLLGGAGVYAVGAQPQLREPSPAAPVTTGSTPTPSEESPTEAEGRGKLIKKKSTEPSGGRHSYPTVPPTSAPSAETSGSDPSVSDTPTPSPTEPDAEETEEPAPEQTEEPEPQPSAEPTGGAEQPEEPAQPAPVPTADRSGK